MAEYLPCPNLGGITLKELLENPNLLLPPPTSITADGEKDGKNDYFYDNEVVDMAAAFLGPTLWDKTLPTETDMKLEYMEIDEFLAENGIYDPAAAQKKASAPVTTAADHQPSFGAAVAPNKEDDRSQPEQETTTADPIVLPQTDEATKENPEISRPVTPNTPPSPIDVPFSISSTDVALATAPGQNEFNPRQKSFTDEDLKPQPMVKKSKKQYVPMEMKDDKYWERRRKNNIAAKRSRDARRVKENQIVIRTSFLEKENDTLKDQIKELKKENSSYKKLLESYKKKLEALNAL